MWHDMICVCYGKQESRWTTKESENKFNKLSTYIKNCTDSKTYVVILGDFVANISKDVEGIVNGDKIISMNGGLLRDMIKLQHLQLINCL